MIPASERAKTVHALDRSATVTGSCRCILFRIIVTIFIIEMFLINNHGIHETPQMNAVLSEIKIWNTKCLRKLENHTNAQQRT
jgi:hypothetical protein